MKRRYLFAIICSFIFTGAIRAQSDYYTNSQRENWLSQAENNKPELSLKEKDPVRIVRLEKDSTAFQDWKVVDAGTTDSFFNTSFKKQSGIVLDFGNHMTGKVTFSLNSINSSSDAPLRLKFIFGEVPSEVAVPFDPYKGTLSRAWLQDETVTVTELPATITIPRRLAFRYVRIELLGASPYYDFRFTNLHVMASTSATSQPAQLAASTPDNIKAIDKVGLKTLAECMQTVFEDGPKRDHRLWIGDLLLESMANQYSFKQYDLTKRCLFLLAGLARTDGFLASNVFETPKPHNQLHSPFNFDYSLLYNIALNKYLQATGDRQTAESLWPVAKRQMDNITKFLDKRGVFDADAAQKNHWWLFVDWSPKLDKQTPLQGIMICSMQETYQLAKELGKEKEVAQLPALITKMQRAARKYLYDSHKHLFVSGVKKQVSYAAQSWMILANVVSGSKAGMVMNTLSHDKSAIKPGAPYLYFYYTQALIKSHLYSKARDFVVNYWGGMVNKGADTFWEVYDPNNDFLSPYNFYPVNSYCHAWSCSPVYFIRKYPEIFQK